jgi:hypothetical protein
VRLPGNASLRVGVIGALLWLGAFWLSLVTFAFTNDHFHRISSARQIAVYGELPFLDYFDPGFFLTELTTAGLMYLFGDNLVGEALLTTIFIATGTLLVFLLALRLTGSTAVSLMASVVALLLLPRAYDYDKVLFYPLGILLCWHYVDRPRLARIWKFSAGVVAAALFRYDNGVFLMAGMVVAVAVVHAGQWRLLPSRMIHLVLAVTCLAGPFLLFIHYQGGLADAVDQMITYARREAARTRLPTQQFAFDSFASIVSSTSADVFLSYLVRLLPLAGVFWLVLDVWAARSSRERAAQVASLTTLCVCLNVFILRDPIGARFGGMAGPLAILSAWIAHRTWREAHTSSRLPRAGVIVVTLLTVWGVSSSARWTQRIQAENIRPAHLVGLFRALSASPARQEAIFNPGIVGLVRYLRECTAPTDRVLATWFVPDLYYYAQRGFAARIVALFGGHWSEPRFERRSANALAGQSVPVVLTRTGDKQFADDYPNIAMYLERYYELAGTSDFGDPGAGTGHYSVWVRRDRPPVRTYADTSLPCF